MPANNLRTRLEEGFFTVSVLPLSAALEFAKQGVRVNAAAFGTIQTPMVDRMVPKSVAD